jgi:hypothetical protein
MGFGSSPVHPKVLLSNLIYGYEGGVFERELECATCDSVAFRFIAANGYPDRDTIEARGARRPSRDDR